MNPEDEHLNFITHSKLPCFTMRCDLYELPGPDPEHEHVAVVPTNGAFGENKLGVWSMDVNPHGFKPGNLLFEVQSLEAARILIKKRLLNWTINWQTGDTSQS